jgi:hypothetical protein
MSKTYKDLTNLFDGSLDKKRGSEGSARFKTEQHYNANKAKEPRRTNKGAKRTKATRIDERLFKQEVRFVSWLERASQD